MAALELWIDRLRSISVIVEQGCRSNGNSGAGELLLDMVGDLVQEICSSRSSPEEQEDGGEKGCRSGNGGRRGSNNAFYSIASCTSQVVLV